jgi:hypothetical protein
MKIYKFRREKCKKCLKYYGSCVELTIQHVQKFRLSLATPDNKVQGRYQELYQGTECFQLFLHVGTIDFIVCNMVTYT